MKSEEKIKMLIGSDWVNAKNARDWNNLINFLSGAIALNAINNGLKNSVLHEDLMFLRSIASSRGVQELIKG